MTYRIRVQQIYTKLLAKHPTTVTPAQIAAYYAAPQAQFGTPETREHADRADQDGRPRPTAPRRRSSSGQSWATVAKKYSIDPTTKNKGGVLTGVTKGQQDAALCHGAFSSAAKGKLLGPIKGQFGYYVLEVTKITPAKPRPWLSPRR